MCLQFQPQVAIVVLSQLAGAELVVGFIATALEWTLGVVVIDVVPVIVVACLVLSADDAVEGVTVTVLVHSEQLSKPLTFRCVRAVSASCCRSGSLSRRWCQTLHRNHPCDT